MRGSGRGGRGGRATFWQGRGDTTQLYEPEEEEGEEQMLYPRLRIPDTSYPKPSFAPHALAEDPNVESFENEMLKLQKETTTYRLYQPCETISADT